MANLTQLKMLEDLNGFLLVDKPEGIAFPTVVKAVKRKFNLVKVGHGGSLEAMASGLMVLLIGDANKFVDRVMGADRAYAGTLRLGLRTNTGDLHGLPAADRRADAASLPGAERLAAVLPQFRGDVFQTEPRFCAVRREGSADYELADTGEHRQFLAHVYRFEVGVEKLGDGGGVLPFSLFASKGVIPRALADDFGEALGCGAVLATLRRTRIGKFDVAEAVSFQQLLETEIRDFRSLVLPLSKAL